MATVIRMARAGAKNRPFYRIVVADKRSPRNGRYIEKLGTYNPALTDDNKNRVMIDLERAKHWLSVGALPSDRVARFLHAAGVLKDKPAYYNPETGPKRPEKLRKHKALVEAAAAAEEAKATAAAEAKAAKEAAAAEAAAAPAEEAKAAE